MDNKEELVLSRIENGIQIVTMNRPKKKNAITIEMYQKLTKSIKESADNQDVIAFALTGSGNFYSSGNDFFSLLTDPSHDPSQMMTALRDWIEALICYPKLLIAIVNGPAIGIAATTLALFDLIYASDTSYFWTPFTNLGLSPEGCSSYTFPLVMGKAKAAEVLFFGEKLTVKEAKEIGFINKIYPADKVDDVIAYLKNLSSLSKMSLEATKRLLCRWNKKTLLEVNKQELEQLMEVNGSPDFLERVMKLFTAKSKM